MQQKQKTHLHEHGHRSRTASRVRLLPPNAAELIRHHPSRVLASRRPLQSTQYRPVRNPLQLPKTVPNDHVYRSPSSPTCTMRETPVQAQGGWGFRQHRQDLLFISALKLIDCMSCPTFEDTTINTCSETRERQCPTGTWCQRESTEHS